MKYLVFVLISCFTVSNSYSKSLLDTNYSYRYVYNDDIDDGWYTATVSYNNYNTGTNSTYRLNVYVESGYVTIINFGNGGSIHTGINNQGYYYSGGELEFETDYDGNITEATATVTISDKYGLKYYKISIE